MAALTVCVAVSAGVWPPSGAGAVTTPTTSAVSNLQQAPRLPGAGPLPKACNLSWPTAAWPPHTDAGAKGHTLRLSDLPPGMQEGPPLYASNGPNLNQLAVGWPEAGIAEVDASTAVRSAQDSSIEEIVGRAKTPARATEIYRKARDVIFGSCVKAWPGHEGQTRYPVPWAGANVFAFEVSDQQDHGVGSVSVMMVGHQGHFDFALQIGTVASTPSPSETAAAPTRIQLSNILRSARARLGR